MESGRKLFIGGNWKCNLTLSATKELINSVLKPMPIDSSKVEVAVFPINLHLSTVKNAITNQGIIVRAD